MLLAFRNGPIEDVPAGRPCSECAGKASISRISDGEMKRITKTAVDRVWTLLRMKHENPGEYDRLLQWASLQTKAWDPPGQAADFRARAGEGEGTMGETWIGADTFVAIDFETADSGGDSAGAVGIVRVEKGRIVHREEQFIRPPRPYFEFTSLHGITGARVAREYGFRELWPKGRPVMAGTAFLSARQASLRTSRGHKNRDSRELPRGGVPRPPRLLRSRPAEKRRSVRAEARGSPGT